MKSREIDSFYWEFQSEGKSVDQPFSPIHLPGPLIHSGEVVDLSTLTVQGGGIVFILGAASRGDLGGVVGGLALVGGAGLVRRLKPQKKG